MDPLNQLPPELIVCTLDLIRPSDLASLTRLNRSWHSFIDETHQDAIYSHPSKTSHPPGVKDLSFLCKKHTYSNYYANVGSWKDLCKRQTTLAKNWNQTKPAASEHFVKPRNHPVWRFRVDLKRRFVLSTSLLGGVSVTDLDTGATLWSLDAQSVRLYAHLEYADGTAVWDREGDALEVWRTDLEGQARGEFKLVALLPHTRQTRGFHLAADVSSLCVASSEGEGYVYDMIGDQPRLKTRVAMEEGAVGHLFQDTGTVVFSLGSKGYHFHDKATGTLMGALHPKECNRVHRIIHPTCFYAGSREKGIIPLYIEEGPYPEVGRRRPGLAEDTWGACILSGKMMVGISRGGRLLVCPDWRGTIKNGEINPSDIFIIEHDTYNDNAFELGGWLSVCKDRVMLEVFNQIYVVGLTEDHRVVAHDSEDRGLALPSFVIGTHLGIGLQRPVSFMALYEDSLWTTYTAIQFRASDVRAGVDPHRRAQLTVGIRALDFTPVLEGDEREREFLMNDPERTEANPFPHRYMPITRAELDRALRGSTDGHNGDEESDDEELAEIEET